MNGQTSTRSGKRNYDILNNDPEKETFDGAAKKVAKLPPVIDLTKKREECADPGCARDARTKVWLMEEEKWESLCYEHGKDSLETNWDIEKEELQSDVVTWFANVVAACDHDWDYQTFDGEEEAWCRGCKLSVRLDEVREYARKNKK